MTLPFEELEAITDDYFMINNGEAVDIYFDTSFLLNYLMKQQKGIWDRPDGGMQIRVPLEYDGQEAEFYSRGDTVSSDDRESLNAALFQWKHAYSNATVYRIDTLKNSGNKAHVQLVRQRVSGSQKSLTRLLASSIYDEYTGATSNRLTGLRACCNENADQQFAAISENDLVAADGTKPWEGKMDSTTDTLTLNFIRTVKSDAKLRDGKNGKPNLVVTTETNWNIVADILQAQQRFVESSMMAKAGFTGLHFEGSDIYPDDYCPTNHLFAINTAHIGFAIHTKGYFARSGWKTIPDSPEDRTMKIYWDGNMVVNNRKAHKGCSNLSQ